MFHFQKKLRGCLFLLAESEHKRCCPYPLPFGFIQQNEQNLERKNKSIKKKGLSRSEMEEGHINGEQAVHTLYSLLAKALLL